jgi:hypothetical protein
MQQFEGLHREEKKQEVEKKTESESEGNGKLSQPIVKLGDGWKDSCVD